MAFKSQAQKAKFKELVDSGKMSQETFDKWLAETPNGPLPDRVATKQNKVIRRVGTAKVIK